MKDSVLNRWTLVTLISTLLFIFSVWFLVTGFEKDRFVEPKVDDSALYDLNPVIDESMNYTVLDSTDVPFSFGLCANPVINNDSAIVWFSNVSGDDWLLLKAFDGDELIGQTGILKDGGYIEKIYGNFNRVQSLTFKVLAYEPNTFYSNGSASVEVNLN